MSGQDWVIRKRGYFYRPNRAGYTSSIHEAGRYTDSEAKAEAKVEPWRISAHPASEFLPVAASGQDHEGLVERLRLRARVYRENIGGHELPDDVEAAATRLESMAAERTDLDPIFAYVREQINYWNKVAFDRRQAGRSDNFACAQASAFQHMEAFLNERFSFLGKDK